MQNTKFRVKNWERFQHYRDRRPAWIKFYTDLLEDPEWMDLDPFASKLLANCWLIASKDPDLEGKLPCLRKLAYLLRLPEKKVLETLDVLNHWILQECYQDASKMLANSYQDASGFGKVCTSETETYKKETEKDILSGKPDIARSILKFLNEKTGKNFQPVKANLSMIQARLAEGYTERQLRVMTARKVNEWGSDEKMREFLRPKTLYNATNCSNYVGELPGDIT